jgi:hypothetical protein
MQLLMLALGLIAPITLDVIVWRRLKGSRCLSAPAPLRRIVAYAAVIVGLVAYMIPLCGIAYNIAIFSRGGPVYADELIDGTFTIKLSMAIATVSLIIGAFSPQNVRKHLLLSGAFIICLGLSILSFPQGVL